MKIMEKKTTVSHLSNNKLPNQTNLALLSAFNNCTAVLLTCRWHTYVVSSSMSIVNKQKISLEIQRSDFISLNHDPVLLWLVWYSLFC